MGKMGNIKAEIRQLYGEENFWMLFVTKDFGRSRTVLKNVSRKLGRKSKMWICGWLARRGIRCMIFYLLRSRR